MVALAGTTPAAMPRRLDRYRLGPPLLSDARDLRNFRLVAGAALIMFVLAGWVANPQGDDWLYTMCSIVGYLVAGALLNVLAVLPTVHRVGSS